MHTTSDVKRGRKLEAEARTMRPRPKIIMKKYQIMINNIWFTIIAGKINKIPEFYTIFARKIPNYITRQRDRGQAEAKTSRPRPKLRGRGQKKFWPRGLNITAYNSVTVVDVGFNTVKWSYELPSQMQLEMSVRTDKCGQRPISRQHSQLFSLMFMEKSCVDTEQSPEQASLS